MGGVYLMKANFNVNFSDFNRKCQVAIEKVQRGTKKATKAACEEILEESLNEVPRDTNNLANSAFYDIHGSYRNFTATVGYGGNGDPVNPKSGQSASDYMVVVHEDLEAAHPTGKAKFLEDPVRRYQEKFPSRAARHIREELGG